MSVGRQLLAVVFACAVLIGGRGAAAQSDDEQASAVHFVQAEPGHGREVVATVVVNAGRNLTHFRRASPV